MDLVKVVLDSWEVRKATSPTRIYRLLCQSAVVQRPIGLELSRVMSYLQLFQRRRRVLQAKIGRILITPVGKLYDRRLVRVIDRKDDVSQTCQRSRHRAIDESGPRIARREDSYGVPLPVSTSVKVERDGREITKLHFKLFEHALRDAQLLAYLAEDLCGQQGHVRHGLRLACVLGIDGEVDGGHEAASGVGMWREDIGAVQVDELEVLDGNRVGARWRWDHESARGAHK